MVAVKVRHISTLVPNQIEDRHEVHLRTYQSTATKVLCRAAKIFKPEDKDQKFYAPNHHAAVRGHVRAIQRLLQNRADVEARTEKEETPLLIAVQHQHKVAAKALCDGRADEKVPNIQETHMA